MSRPFPDNRSHLCQVVEPQGFPLLLSPDSLVIRYILPARPVSAGVRARAKLIVASETRKESLVRDEGRATYELGKIEGDGTKMRRKEEEAGGGREHNCTIYPGAWQALFRVHEPRRPGRIRRSLLQFSYRPPPPFQIDPGIFRSDIIIASSSTRFLYLSVAVHWSEIRLAVFGHDR